MNRREFIAGVASAAALPLLPNAAQPPVLRMLADLRDYEDAEHLYSRFMVKFLENVANRYGLTYEQITADLGEAPYSSVRHKRELQHESGLAA